jgi:hypothetical protein
MNEQDLDEILNTWNAPEPPPSLRGRMRARYAAAVEKPRGHRRMAMWASAFGAAAFLVVLTQAFPQTVKIKPASNIPFTVESELINYDDEGAVYRVIDQTSYARAGQEVVLAEVIPDHPVESFFMNFHQSMYSLFTDIHGLISGHKEEAPVLGPGCTAGRPAPHQTILNYDTVDESVEGNGRRAHTWRAPQLACFPLRSTFERQRPDGTYRLVFERRALKVTINKVQ